MVAQVELVSQSQKKVQHVSLQIGTKLGQIQRILAAQEGLAAMQYVCLQAEIKLCQNQIVVQRIQAAQEGLVAQVIQR